MELTATTAQSIGGIRVEPRPRCVLCGGGGDFLYTTLIDHQYGIPGKWSLRKCRKQTCSLVWQDPMIVADDLPLAYKTYYTHVGQDTFGPDSISRRVFSFLDRRAEFFLGLKPDRILLKYGYMDDMPSGALLDIGCGSGDFAARMQSRGWSVRGLDVDPHAATAATRNHGFRVDVGELEQLAYPDGYFDAVSGRHVLEHLRDPKAFLLECWRILKPGGRLILVTPNMASFGHEIYREHWQGLEPPRHLFLFATHTLRSLAAACGIQPATVFSTAQGASYIFRGSERIRVGQYDAGQSWTRTWGKYWFWLFQEVRRLRSGASDCGEELILIANKPAPRLAAVTSTADPANCRAQSKPGLRACSSRY